MSTNRTHWITVAAMAVAMLVGASVAAAAGGDPPGVGPAESSASLAVDVAEDGTRFVFDEAPILENGYPAYGNAFVTQGYIYPIGTLDETNGVLEDGSPEFPYQVIGEWTCWGYFVGDGADTTEGAWVVTTQVFEFDAVTTGQNTIITTGFETPAGAGPAIRAVTGGTGVWAGASGDLVQVTLGHNASDGVNARFDFTITGADSPSVFPAR